MTSSAEAVAAITENNLVTDESNAAKADATEEESYVMSVENKPEEVELSNEISSLQISGNDKNNDNESHNNAPKVKITRTTPRRNPSTESARSGPLPTIEECLFGNKPVIAMDGSLLPEEQRKEEDYILPLNLLRRVASQGIDDGDDTVENQSSLRALSWRVLLGYLPMDRREWKSTTAKQRASYHTFVQELFAIDKRDIDGTELRGHHAKRRSKLKVKRTKSEKERRRKDKLKQKQELLEAADSSPRAPIKFVNDDNDEEDDSNDNNASSQWLEAAPSEDISEGGGVPSDLQEESAAEKAANHHTLEQIVQEPSHWNLSDREQKILERLTNHQAVNQLLVKRDCAEWNNFLENATLLDEIRKDVNRTHPHLYFYLEPKRQLGARRYGALERILFVWAKLNKGVSD